MSMTPTEFIKKWKAANLKERSAAQEHFIDLCRLLGELTPAEADPEGAWYCFERGASKLDRRQRLGGCLETWTFRLGVQEQAQGSASRLCAAPAIRCCPGESSAASGV